MKIFLIIVTCLFLDTAENEKETIQSPVEAEQSECYSETDVLDFNNHIIIPNLLLVN
jgi:hypothetical protein